MKKLVSVIVPIYNSEKFLDICIESLVNQTYTNLEIILLNDGSKDNSLDICNKWASKDKRIIVIDKENTGVSDTRNMGIAKCSGEFVTFIDSDDKLEPDAIELLLNAIIKDSSDISIGGLKTFYESNQKSKFITANVDTTLNKSEFVEELLKERYFIASLWGKLYKKELLEKETLDKTLRIAEDLDFLVKLSNHISQVSLVGKPLYNYFINSSSVTKTASFEKFNDEILVLERLLKNKKLPQKLVQCRYLRINLALCFKYRKISPNNSQECLKKIKSIKPSIGFSSYFNTKQKIKYLLAKYFM